MKEPTNDELARTIVRVLIEDGNRAGEGLPRPALWHLAQQAGIERADDFNRGCAQALALGWIEENRDGFFVKLTAAGFEAA